MNKNIYNLLNEVSVEEPKEVEAMSTAEIEAYKKKFTSSILDKRKDAPGFRFMKIGLAAALIMAIFSMTAPGTIVYAKIVEIFSSMINPISEYSIVPEITDNYIEKLDKEVISNGVKFTVKEVLIDGNTIYLNTLYEIEDENLVKEFKPGSIVIPVRNIKVDLKLNGEIINFQKMGTMRSTFVDSRTWQEYLKIQFFDELKDQDIITLEQKELDIRAFTEFNGFDTVMEKSSVEGDWTVDILVNESSNKVKTNLMTVNKTLITVDNYPVVFEEFSINPFRAVIKLKYEREARFIGSKTIFVARDENGTTYNFDRVSSGNEVSELNYFGEDNKNITEANSLTFQAHFVQDMEAEIFIPYGEPITINLN